MTDVLARLEALRDIPRTPGWDRKVEAQTIKMVYGDTERFLEAHIAKVKEAIRFARVEELDQE